MILFPSGVLKQLFLGDFKMATKTKTKTIKYGKTKNAKLFPSRSKIQSFADATADNEKMLSVQITQPVLGNISNPLTPRRNNNQLLIKQGLQLSQLRDLMEDAMLTAAVEARKSATLASEFRLVQGETDAKIYKTLNTFFSKNNIRKLIESMLDAPLYGYMPYELIWESIDGTWLPVIIEDRPPENVAYNYSNDLLYKDSNGQYHLAEPYKFLVVGHRQSSVFPYGDPLLTKVYWAIYFKMESNRNINKYVARFMKPFVTAKFDANELGRQFDTSYSTLVEEIYDSVMDMMDTGLLVHPEGIELKTQVVTGGSTANLNNNLQKDNNKEIITAITGNESTTLAVPGQLGGNSAGSLASVVSGAIVESDQTMICNAFNGIIEMINELNWQTEILPTFQFFEESKINKEKAERDSIISGMGFKLSKEYLKREYNYKDEDLDVDTSNEALSGMFDYIDNFKAPKEPKSERVLDQFIQWLQDPDASPFDIEQHLQPILKHVKKSKDLKTALKTLDVVYDDLDHGNLQNTIYYAMNLAQMYGIDIEQQESK